MEAFLLLIGPVAIVVTKVVDTVRNLIDDDDSLPKALWNVLAFGLGVGYALLWQVNFTDVVNGLPSSIDFTGLVGQIATGLGIGAVASGWHEVFSALSARSGPGVIR